MILVTGGNGQLATCLRELLPDATFLDSKELDITNVANTKEVIQRTNPKFVINCAAFTHVDKCEEEVDSSWAVNAEGPKNLAKLSNEFNFRLIHISTDYVFDGNANIPYKENDKTSPQSQYGKGKLTGEKNIQDFSKNFIIIRTSWLYSEFGSNFVKNIKKLMTQRDTLGIVYDQVGSPTYAGDLARAIVEVCKTDGDLSNEVFHFANSGVASWYDLTKEIQSFLNINCLVRPIESFEYPTPAKRPHYSVFNTRKIQEKYNIQIPYWRESLRKCLQKRS